MITGFPTLLPLVAKPFNQFFKPSQLPEYTAFAKICATTLNQSQEPYSAVTGTQLPLGGEKQL